MKKHLLVALALTMACALPFVVMGCGGSSNTSGANSSAAPAEPSSSEPAATTPEPATTEPAQTPESEAPSAGTEQMSSEPAAAESTAEPVAEEAAKAAAEGTEAKGEALTAENIVGTKWNAGGMTFTFEKDGVLKVNDQIPGTWSIDGNTLKVGAMGTEYSATIEGNKIVYDGNPLERTN